jgi:hypothetical protein
VVFSYKADAARTPTRSQTFKPLDIQLALPLEKAGPVLISSILCKGPELWNELPVSIKNSKMKKELKTKLKTHILAHYVN